MNDELATINELHLWDFEIAKHENGTLLLLGSNDFTYSHYLEAEFFGVVHCDLPQTFSHAQFQLGRVEDGVATISVNAESMITTATDFQIRAAALQVRIGRVPYSAPAPPPHKESPPSAATRSAYLAIFLFVLAPIGAIVLMTALLLFGVPPPVVFAPGRLLRAVLEAGGGHVANRVAVISTGFFWWLVIATAGYVWDRVRSR